MTRTLFMAAALSLTLLHGASAQEAPQPPANLGNDTAPLSDSAGQRFRFSKQGDGVLRLDSQTGQVSFCSARSVGWACQVAPDDRAALDTEIARLQSQVDALNKEIVSLRTATVEPPRPPETVPPSKNGELKLPSRADLDRAKSFLDDAWRRLVEMIDQWRKDFSKT